MTDDSADKASGQVGVGGGVQAGNQLEQAAPMIEAEYTGLLRPGRTEGTVQGFLFCRDEAIRIEFRGHKDARKGKGYFLFGQRIRLQAELDV